MSANLMVRACSCPARDTLCSGGQMLSMSQMGQSRRFDCLIDFRFAPVNGHGQVGPAGPFRAPISDIDHGWQLSQRGS